MNEKKEMTNFEKAMRCIQALTLLSAFVLIIIAAIGVADFAGGIYIAFTVFYLLEALVNVKNGKRIKGVVYFIIAALGALVAVMHFIG